MLAFSELASPLGASQLAVIPGRLGSGTNFNQPGASEAARRGSDGQITLGVLPSHPMNWSRTTWPLTARVVAGSNTGLGHSLKSPLRIFAVGTVRIGLFVEPTER